MSVKTYFFFLFPIQTVSRVLVISPTPAEFDLDLFIRPFRREAWIGICMSIAAILITAFLPYLYIRDYFSTHGFRLFVITGWLFFVVLEIYYGGVLTMFFTSNTPLPFKTPADVMKAYPGWKLLYEAGDEFIILRDVAKGKNKITNFACSPKLRTSDIA